MKNKRLLLVMVLIMLVFLVVGSLVVEAGIKDKFKEMTSKLGDVKGYGVIAVNAIIIAAVLYFGLNLIPQLKPGSKPGHIVFAAVVIIMAVMFAVHIGGEHFIWQKPSFEAGLNYLFKESYDVKKLDGTTKTVHGIFHPAHIWKFIGLALIISWLFVTFLDVGKGKHIIDIILAVILAANATHNGVSLDSVIWISKIIAILILTVQFHKNLGLPGGEGFKWAASFLIAAALVLYISHIVFSDIVKEGIEQGKPMKQIRQEVKEGQPPEERASYAGVLIAFIISIFIGYIALAKRKGWFPF